MMQEDQPPRPRLKTYEEKLKEADDAANAPQPDDAGQRRHELTVPVYAENSGEQIGQECAVCHEPMRCPG